MAAERLTDEELAKLEQYANDPDSEALTMSALLAPYAARLLAEVRASRELLVELEWGGCEYHEGSAACPECHALERNDYGTGGVVHVHESGCKLAALLGREERKP